MISYAARAVPWVLLGTGAGLIVGLLLLVERWPYTLWPLQGIAVGLLAGIAVWCYHEPAAAVVDTLPRGLRWRTFVRSAGSLALLIVWLITVRETRSAYFGHPRDVAWQGIAAVIVGACYLTWCRSRGSTGPARAASAGIVGVAMFVALARPLAPHVPVFPYTATEHWEASRLLWSALCLAAIALLLIGNRAACSVGRCRLLHPAGHLEGSRAT
jgi:hypothetical protein